MKISLTPGVAAAVPFVIGLGLLAVVFLRPRDRPVIPKAQERTIDSLVITKPIFEARQDTLTTHAQRADSAAHRALRTSQRRQDSALKASVRADSLARLASAQADSAMFWEAAYWARTAEAVQLHLEVQALQLAADSLQGEVGYWQLKYASDTTRRVAIEQLNASLQRVAERAGRCRIIGLLDCPTRLQTAAATLLGAAIVHYAAK